VGIDGNPHLAVGRYDRLDVRVAEQACGDPAGPPVVVEPPLVAGLGAGRV
jgi:hypothetical protein